MRVEGFGFSRKQDSGCRIVACLFLGGYLSLLGAGVYALVPETVHILGSTPPNPPGGGWSVEDEGSRVEG